MLAWIALAAAAALPAEDGAAALERLRLSAEVARAGEAARDPVLLIAAARMRRRAGVLPDAAAPDRAEAWLASAEALGGDDPRVASLVADVRAEARKGRFTGPRVAAALLRGGERRQVTETFRAGRPAVVYIEGDGDTDLTLTVGTACVDRKPGDVKICAWTPRADERVTIEIANPGRVDNRVILGTN